MNKESWDEFHTINEAYVQAYQAYAKRLMKIYEENPNMSVAKVMVMTTPEGKTFELLYRQLDYKLRHG